MTQTELQRVHDLIASGDKEAAMNMLAPLVEADPHNMAAWSLLAKACKSKNQRIAVLEECLKNNPGNPKVQAALDKLKTPQNAPYDFQDAYAEPREKTKKCPKCAERIKANAKVCRFCGADFKKIAYSRKWYFNPAVKVLTFLFITPLWSIIMLEDPRSSTGEKIIAGILFAVYVIFICTWWF